MKVVIIIVLLFLGYVAYNIWTTANQMYEPPTQTKSEKRSKIVQIQEDPFSILLLGVDERPGDIGRSDTMMILTLNPHQKTMLLTNIPRDTLVTIPGRTHKDKINHSYAYGGVELARKTVENFLDIPIDGYVKVNMQGLEGIVDALGGIEVQVPFDFTFNGIKYHQGKMTLNGRESLAFARMRKVDPRGDFGRIDRQQQVIRGIIDKGSQFSSLQRFDEITEQLGTNLKTDIPPFQFIRLQQSYPSMKSQDIQTITLHGADRRINGVYYFQVSQSEIQRVHQRLAEHLELE
ncbi:LCP family protein [Hazenella coriacea]|nr:LCP family protein [Hazenella coriacea]